jgi:mRNA interferase RelE/StbE
MVWQVEFSDVVDKQLAKLDNNIRHRIISWLDQLLSGCSNPRLWGKALSGS